MRTQAMIMLIVTTVMFVVTIVVGALVTFLGWSAGLSVAAAALAVILVVYFLIIKPWHLRWGATDDEATRPMPGDDLIPDAKSATRAISINAGPDAIWPWLVQIGFGKAGWYSYDWIDNDGKSSADHIIDDFQQLAVGDRILMMPTMGFVVRALEPDRFIVSVLDDGSVSWVLGLYPTSSGATRLLSRWRPKLDMSPGAFLMSALSEPGTFIMEQKMLRTIRDRVESAEQEVRT